MRSTEYKPPFVWFGGKSAVADLVWQAFGDVDNYVEPFFGSGAVLFLRPGGPGKVETVNDADGFVANFWRAVQHDPDAVADHADWPVNECDLHARHLWLIGQRERITDRLCGDPDFYDAKVAGWWVWGLNCWIGGGWCSGNGSWQSVDGVMVKVEGCVNGVSRRRPHLMRGQGVNRRRPHLGDTGRGVLRQQSDIDGTGQSRREWLRDYLGRFSQRLARVRVCCGDWSRVCGPSVTFIHGMTGVFLDPPYADTAGRRKDIYATDCLRVAHDVRRWAIEQGENPAMRIVLAGYEGEHDMPKNWRKIEWQTAGGYGRLSKRSDATGRVNRKRERLWCSPSCLDPDAGSLFSGVSS